MENNPKGLNLPGKRNKVEKLVIFCTHVLKKSNCISSVSVIEECCDFHDLQRCNKKESTIYFFTEKQIVLKVFHNNIYAMQGR